MVFRPGIHHVEYRPRDWSYRPPARDLPPDEAAVVDVPPGAPVPPDEAAVAGPTRIVGPAGSAGPAGITRPADPPRLTPGGPAAHQVDGPAPSARPDSHRPDAASAVAWPAADPVLPAPDRATASWKRPTGPGTASTEATAARTGGPEAGGSHQRHGQAGSGGLPAAPPVPPAPAPPPPVPGAIVPGPPGGVLDLTALAEVEERLLGCAHAGIDAAAQAAGARGGTLAERRGSLATAASSVAAALWFDTLRAEDRVSVTPDAAPLLSAVHELLEAARPAAPDDLVGQLPDGPPATGWDSAAGGELVGRLPVPSGRAARSLRATGAGTVGPCGTVWGALARRFAGTRFDQLPGGRIIGLLDYPELRDPAVWAAVTDERTPYLGELFWIVLVTGAAVGAESAGPRRTGLGGPGGPDRAARMFEAAGWQVLTLRYGRRLTALFGRPGGQALRARLGRMPEQEYRELLGARGLELRRRLAGPGAAGVGVAGLLETLTDEQIHAALRDLGGHDLALLIDAFDEIADDRPTVLFAHVHDAWTRGPAAPNVRPDPQPATGITAIRQPASDPGPAPASGAGQSSPPAPAGARGARLATHVASYLDRAHRQAASPPPVPADLPVGGAADGGDPGRAPGLAVSPPPGPAGVAAGGGPADGRAADRPANRGPIAVSSTQDAFGDLLRRLAAAAPEAARALVTVSTRDSDAVVAGWLDPAAGATVPAADPRGEGGRGREAGRARDVVASAAGRRHVAGAFAPGAFTGVLGNLGVAWNREGLPLLAVGVADELRAGRVVPAWAAGCAADARSVLAITDVPISDPASTAVSGDGAGGGASGRSRGGGARPAGWAVMGGGRLPGVVRYEPAFAQDLAWCLLAGLGRLGRADGSSTLLRLSARPVDQRAAAVPAAGPQRARRRAGVLAGGYRLRSGGAEPALTLVGMGPVLPEVLAAADTLTDRLDGGIAVVVVTSPDLVFDALRAREAAPRGDHGPAGGGPKGDGRAEDDGRTQDDDPAWVLDEMFPAPARAPLLTVVDGDPRELAFLAAVHGDRLAALGPTDAAWDAPVPTATIVEAALRLAAPAGPA